MAVNNFDVFNSVCWAENSINKIRAILEDTSVQEAARVQAAKELCNRELMAIGKLKMRYTHTE